jgi:hypothetical protein
MTPRLPPDFSDTASVNWEPEQTAESLRAAVAVLLDAYIADCERAGDPVGGPEAFAAGIPFMHGWDDAHRHIYQPRVTS